MKLLLFLLFVSLALVPQKAQAQPCSGAPVAGTLTATPSVYCMSSSLPLNVVITLSGYTNASGISFQWEDSVTSSPWMFIPGGTSPVYSTSLLVPHSYRVRVMCANSGVSTVTPTLVVGYSSPNCQDSVWPGDVNYDLITDNLDALDLAVAIGSTGTTRSGASIAYQPQFSMDWSQSFASTVNYKNADCDGNGAVTIADTLAIFNNYGLTHPKEVHTPKATTNPDLYFDLTGIQFIPGATVSVPIKLGSTAVPMNNLYGLAAQVKVGGITLASAPVITYNTSWLGTNANTLRFRKAVNPDRVDWTYSRVDHQNTSGNGTLATLTFTIPTNATGQAILYFDNVKMIDNAGTPITGFNVVDDTANIVPVGISATEFNSGSVTLVPNPSGSMAHLALSFAHSQQLSLSITDLVGRTVWTHPGAVNSGKQKILLPSDLAPGIYVIRVEGGSSAQTLKWIKNR